MSFLAFLNRMNPHIPLALPPPLGLPLLPPAPVNDRPYLLGDEISYEDLVPGQEYYRREIWGQTPRYNRIKLVDKTNSVYNFQKITDDEVYPTNMRGNPLFPYTVPSAPLPPGFNPPNRVIFTLYTPERTTFYKISAVKRGRHMVGPLIKEKLKKNIRRKHLDMMLNKVDFSTDVGTGPADIVRKFVDLQPPRGAKSMPIRTRRGGGKRRKTRRTPK